MKILVTGGAGFIGSTIASALIDKGHTPVILDSLVTGRREFTIGRAFYEGDIRDRHVVHRIFADHPDIEAAVHCAALIVVPDSMVRPLEYYDTNVAGTLALTEALLANGCHRMLFSSSASIYRPGDDFTVDEDSDVAPLSPYARTKAMIESMLADVAAATPLRVMSLRYFNPIGSDPMLRTGLQLAKPSHALGKLIEADAARAPFALTGTTFATRDGSGIRDYVHVWDLAQAHVAALVRFDGVMSGGTHVAINLGTGTGTTTRELVAAFERATGRSMPVDERPARPGDSVGAYTRSTRAEEMLGWRAEFSIERGILDTLAWFARRVALLPDLVPASVDVLPRSLRETDLRCTA